MKTPELGGSVVPLLTPFDAQGQLDSDSLRRLVDYVIQGGSKGLWLMGTTGEFAALEEVERAKAIEIAVEHAAGRVHVVANVADASTERALRHGARAAAAGVHALALTPPYYYPHSIGEIADHFRRLKMSYPDMPLFAYNIPQTVKTVMDVRSVIDLAREGVIVGIKDSQNSLDWARRLHTGLKQAGLRDGFRILLGTRSLIDLAPLVGADGSVPAISNLAPELCSLTHQLSADGQHGIATLGQELLLDYESLAQLAVGGSSQAATLGAMKHSLVDLGVLSSARVTGPLKELSSSEVDAIRAQRISLEARARELLPELRQSVSKATWPSS